MGRTFAEKPSSQSKPKRTQAIKKDTNKREQAKKDRSAGNNNA